MTLRAVEIENFKCFTKLRLDLAPLTFVTGFNAAGKSTALQSILLLAQAFQTDTSLKAVPLRGRIVRLGLPGDVISSHATTRSITIGLQTKNDFASWTLEPKELGLGLLHVTSAIHTTGDGKSKAWKHSIWKDRVGGQGSIDDALRRTIYLSAVRVGSTAQFQVLDHAGRVPADVGVEGQYAPWWLAKSADDEVAVGRRHPKEPASSVRRQLDAYLSDLFPNAQANAEQIVRTSLVRLEFKTSTTADWRRPINVGYGLSYAFPIVLLLLIAERDQVVIIDSPEAHLHPRAQSLMGRMLAHFAASGIQIIIETHSDHVLNGARLAIRDGVINPGNVALHFFSGATEKTHGITSVQVDKSGTINEWPSGFFDQSEQDMSRLAGWE